VQKTTQQGLAGIRSSIKSGITAAFLGILTTMSWKRKLLMEHHSLLCAHRRWNWLYAVQTCLTCSGNKSWAESWLIDGLKGAELGLPASLSSFWLAKLIPRGCYLATLTLLVARTQFDLINFILATDGERIHYLTIPRLNSPREVWPRLKVIYSRLRSGASQSP